MCFFENEKLFSEIYQKYSNYIYKTSYMYMKNTYDAEDAVQFSFSKLYSSNMNFESEEHVKAWLLTVASNYCKNQLRHWWKKRREDLDMKEIINESSSCQADDASNKVIESIKLLPAKYKMPIILYYYDEYDIKKIASILHKNENTVKTLLKRGKEKMKIHLDLEEIDEKQYYKKCD